MASAYTPSRRAPSPSASAHSVDAAASTDDIAYRTPSGEHIHKLRWSTTAPDLLALGGTSTLDVLQCEWTQGIDRPTQPRLHRLHSVRLGSPITALAWSSRTEPMSDSDSFPDALPRFIEIAAATLDRKVHLVQFLLPPSSVSETTRIQQRHHTFGGGFAGHRARINDVAFLDASQAGAGAPSMGDGEGEGDLEGTWRGVLATVGDDNVCLIWNLGGKKDGSDVHVGKGMVEGDERLRQDIDPTAYAITLPRPALSVSFHPSLFSQLMVYDIAGTLRLLDWVTPSSPSALLTTLHDPRGLAGQMSRTGGADWSMHDANIFGAVMNGKWNVWDLRGTGGGQPIGCGESGAGTVFRWSLSNPRLFAISSDNSIKVYNTAYPQSPLTLCSTAKQIKILDFAWHPESEIVAASVGGEVLLLLATT